MRERQLEPKDGEKRGYDNDREKRLLAKGLMPPRFYEEREEQEKNNKNVKENTVRGVIRVRLTIA